AQAGRYHLYVALACPWAHRTVILRKLKGLENVIYMSTVSPDMLTDGWTFNTEEGSSGDEINGKSKLSEIYLLADPKYSGRVSVPVLWDKQRKTVVNNESPEIIRMLNSAFDKFTNIHTDYYPEPLRADIDRLNDKIYSNINNGVYRSGFATSQAAYEKAFRALFDTLDEMEQLLSRQRFLVGGQITEADWRFFTTLVRFDAVYYSHFKCNWRHIYEYPNLSNYLRDLFQVPGVAGTVSLEQIKRHYYFSQRQVNPTGIVPVGPQLDLAAPHDRERFG
ncbi:MAG: glutathione S-transferase family protein, partial [Pseudolabrys sp.]